MQVDPYKGRLVDARYELLERIGEGAMGAVYRAHQRVVDRAVAVKLLHRDFAENEDFRARFEREAKALGKLDHPGCVRVYDFGWFDDAAAPYLVSEFVEGAPMYEQYGPDLSHADRIRFARDIASAMGHAHGHGIVHRDLKPENVLVSSSGQIKVVDFGLARMPKEEEVRLTRAGDAHGTPAYMSPEQCRGDEVVTPAADVYALGCMLFEMFEDRLPYFGPTASGVLIKHVTEPIPPQRNKSTPPRLRGLIVRMMQKDATVRPSMDEVATELQEVLAELEQNEVTATVPPDNAARPVDTIPDAPAAEAPAPAARTADQHDLFTTLVEPGRPLTRLVALASVAAFLALVTVIALIVIAQSEAPAESPTAPPPEPAPAVEIVQKEVGRVPQQPLVEAEPTEAAEPATDEVVVPVPDDVPTEAKPATKAHARAKSEEPREAEPAAPAPGADPEPEESPKSQKSRRDSVKLVY